MTESFLCPVFCRDEKRFDRLSELSSIDRLAQIPVKPSGQQSLAVTVHRVRCGGEYRKMFERWVLPDLPKKLFSAAIGNSNIGDNQLGISFDK